MKKEQKVKLGMSLALATLLSLSVTGCGGGDSATADAISSAVDVTVERGKVYDANVTDSSTPPQVATQKARQNVYTFANAPVYPVVVNGGWIDVNDDGLMDVNDTKLDIQMMSYTTVVTPVSTFIADANETLREQKLADLLAALNTAKVGTDANVTAEDLLKVPSAAPRDVMVISNAIFKDMKENPTVAPALNDVITQYGTIYSPTATSVELEQAVLAVLETTSTVEKVSLADLSTYEHDVLGVALSPLAKGLIDGTITSEHYMLNPVHSHFMADFRFDFGATYYETWRVQDNILTISGADGDKTEVIFESATPTNGSSITIKGYYGDTIQDTTGYTVTVVEPEPIVTTPTNPVVTTPTTVDLSGYGSIIIYKNIDQTIADSLLTVYQNNSGFKSESRSASCTDFGFTNPTTYANVSTYTIIDGAASRVCVESDYTSAAYGSGSANILAYYGN